MRHIVLASSSPKRKELLEQIGLPFRVDPSGEPEDLSGALAPAELTKKLSLHKALAVGRRHNDAIVIGADSVAFLDGQAIGKPGSPHQARKLLSSANGRTHSLVTGFTILDTRDGRSVSEAIESRVHMRHLMPAELDAYVASGEPLDKAGGYDIQGLGALIVDRIEGDYSNVLGLPLATLGRRLKEFDIDALVAPSGVRVEQGSVDASKPNGVDRT